MIQVNRIYLIFNRLVTKKFLVDTSEIKGKKKFGVSISCVNLTAVVDLNTSKMEKCDISNNFREVIIFK